MPPSPLQILTGVLTAVWNWLDDHNWVASLAVAVVALIVAILAYRDQKQRRKQKMEEYQAMKAAQIIEYAKLSDDVYHRWAPPPTPSKPPLIQLNWLIYVTIALWVLSLLLLLWP